MDKIRNFAYLSSDRKWRFTRYCAKQRVLNKLANKFENCHVGFGSVPGGFANRIKGKILFFFVAR